MAVLHTKPTIDYIQDLRDLIRDIEIFENATSFHDDHLYTGNCGDSGDGNARRSNYLKAAINSYVNAHKTHILVSATSKLKAELENIKQSLKQLGLFP